MKIGVLALQGAVKPHLVKLKSLGVEGVQVRKPEHLQGLSGIIIPGGESSTFIHLLKLNHLWEPLIEFAKQKPTWGICAGAILLSSEVRSPEQEALGLLPIRATRNAYGRQLESFIDDLIWEKTHEKVEGVFIRAPKLTALDESVKVLATYGEEPVMLEKDHLLVSAFHPELTDSPLMHEYFINKCHG